VTTVRGNGHEHELEPEYGLPEPLPAGERILWQGSPRFGTLARSAFHLRKLALYFGLLVGWRAVTVVHDGAGLAALPAALAWPLLLSALGLGGVALLAWLSARTTVYTVTDRRVVMRIGIVLTLTFNLPYAAIASADLRRREGGRGDIALALGGTDRIGWVHLWPHARPWRVARPEPMLRSIDDAARVAGLLTEAWSASRAAAATAPAPAAGAAVPDAQEPRDVPRPSWRPSLT
jgi:hypothetical protein